MNNLESFISAFDSELALLEAEIHSVIEHPMPLLHQILKHITESKGKRLRPLILIAFLKMLNQKISSDTYSVAAAIELIHNATLLHDDVIDMSPLRRGNPTSHTIWGNRKTILVGDYLFTKAFHLISQTSNIEILKVIISASINLAEGELEQISNMKNFSIDLDRILSIIDSKTARLFVSSCEIASIIGNCSKENKEKMKIYGQSIGILFQIADDILDYNGTSEELGKPLGQDFLEGKITLPLFFALQNSSQEDKEEIYSILESPQKNNFETVKAFVVSNNGIKDTLKFSEKIKTKALEALKNFPANRSKNFLEILPEYCLLRVK